MAVLLQLRISCQRLRGSKLGLTGLSMSISIFAGYWKAKFGSKSKCGSGSGSGSGSCLAMWLDLRILKPKFVKVG